CARWASANFDFW
nr:immunoglobulin heavy chain junction region [Macaca mulatta]